MKADAHAIYQAQSRRQAEAGFRAFRRRWQPLYASMVRQLERDLPELLSFFSFPRHLWRKLRTTNINERCFVEGRRTRPMVCFVNVKSVDRIIYSIFQRFNLEWKNRTLRFLHKQLDVTIAVPPAAPIARHFAILACGKPNRGCDKAPGYIFLGFAHRIVRKCLSPTTCTTSAARKNFLQA